MELLEAPGPPAPPAAHARVAHRRPIVAVGLRLLEYQTAAVSIALVALVVFFSITQSGTFDTVANVKNLGLDASQTMLLAVGLTFVIVAGGLDLSVGSVLVFASVAGAKVMNGQADTWWTVALGLVVAVGSGAAWGLLNGTLIARVGLSPIIVTLGSFGAAQGLAEVMAGDADVGGRLPDKLIDDVGLGELLGLSYLIWIAVACAVVGGVVLKLTRFGLRTYALGSNEEAARRAGIDVRRQKMVIYALTGALAGLAAFASLARFGGTTIAGHTTDNVDAITAVILGGVSLFGGIGSMVGTVVGVFIPVVLANGFTMAGLSSSWQQVAVGGVLVAAVYLDRLRRAHAERD
jgi:ribose transport system permease protein